MTKVLSLPEVVARFGELVAEIGVTGEPLTITVDGRPVAILTPADHSGEPAIDPGSGPASADDYKALGRTEALRDVLRAEKA